jgi:hypothetical protein
VSGMEQLYIVKTRAYFYSHYKQATATAANVWNTPAPIGVATAHLAEFKGERSGDAWIEPVNPRAVVIQYPDPLSICGWIDDQYFERRRDAIDYIDAHGHGPDDIRVVDMDGEELDDWHETVLAKRGIYV